MKKTSLLLLLLCYLNIYAEEQYPRFHHLTSANGLLRGGVTCFLQDSRGFIWIGSEEGLNKFDGYDVTAYRFNNQNTNTIAGNSVRCLFEDSRNNLWIGLKGDGLSKLDLVTGRFKSYRHDGRDSNSLSYDDVAGIVEDEKGNLWIAVDRGHLDMFDPVKEKFTHFSTFDNVNNVALNNALTDIALDKKGYIWLSTWGGGVCRFDTNTKIFEDMSGGNEVSEHEFCRHIFDIFLDKDDKLWVSSAHCGLYKFDGSTFHNQTKHLQQANDNINNFYTKAASEDLYGNIWVITSDKVNVLDRHTHTLKYIFNAENNDMGILSNSANCIYSDNDGTIWIGHHTGVSYYNPLFSQFQFVPVEQIQKNQNNDQRVLALMKDKSGLIWTGEVNNLDIYNSKGSFLKRFVPPNLMSSDNNRYNQAICQDRFGSIWVGSYSNILLKYSATTNDFERIRIEGGDNSRLPYGNVRDIYEDPSDSTLWIATETGTVNYDSELNVFTPLFQSKRVIYPEDKSRVVLRDKAGELWVGTEGGLRRFNKKQTSIYTTKSQTPSLVNNYITALFIDSQDNFWVGTRAGLHLMNRDAGTFTLIKQSEKPYGDPVLGMGEDYKGNLWICTTSEMLKYNHFSSTYTVYNESDGLQGDCLQKVFYQADDGQMFVGGTKGFNMFYPDRLLADSSYHPVVITDFQIFNNSVTPSVGGIIEKVVSETDCITIKHSQSVISFKFTSLNITSPEKVKYRYMMEGFDHGWTQVSSKQRTATYTNLDAGEYVFRVMATNNEGKWGSQSTDLRIKILPPFWSTRVAFVLYAILVLGLIYLVVRYSVVRERDRNSVRLARLEARQAHELDDMRTELYTNISHEFRTPLTLIIGPLKQIMDKRGGNDVDIQLYRLMLRNVKRLQRLINQFLDFRKLEEGRLRLHLSQSDIVGFISGIADTFAFMVSEKDIDYNFSSDIDELEMNFDVDKLDKILYNIISNAIKYTPNGGKITITLDKCEQVEGEFIRIKVCDTGIGLSKEALTKVFDVFYCEEKTSKHQKDGFGVGLSLTKALVELHGGTISVSSVENEGSLFTVLLPIVREFPTGADSVKDMGANDTDDINIVYNRPAMTATSNNLDSQETVLVVEDNPDMRAYIRGILSDRFIIIEAANGRIGYDVAMKEIPDIIISDIMMPEVDGVEMIKLLKNNAKTDHIPLVLLTARHTENQIIEGLNIGAADYMTKPFSAEILKARIRNILDSRSKLWELYKRAGTIAEFKKTIRASEMKPEFIEKMDLIIHTHLANSTFGVDILAEQLNMSIDQLSRKVKALTNNTPYNIIIHTRMEKAINLMKIGKLNVTEVAFAVGYNEVSNFSCAFKKHFGQSPREYLNSIR